MFHVITTPSTAATSTLDERFVLLEAIGRGGQGRVFRAYDRLEHGEVAIKILVPGAETASPSALAAEYAAWIRLRHPNVVRALEIGFAFSGPVAKDTPYLVLELVRGLPTHRALTPGRVPVATIETLARELLAALAHVHEAGLVHRDLKPGNVLVSSVRGRLSRVKLTDFGLASESGRAGPFGRISGSLPYVSPEAVLGLPVDGRADLYGLGVLLYLVTTGVLPIDSRSANRWLRWHLCGPPADPRRARPETPARLAELIVRLTARDRDARPPTAAEALTLVGPATPRAVRASAALLPSERARLRLAVDAARRGGTIVLDLPQGRAAERSMRAELAALAGVQRLRCLTLERNGRPKTSNLARVVFGLLLDRGPEIPPLCERHGLCRALPLSLLGGVPVWDHSACGPPPRRPSSLAVPARGIAAFLREAARRRTLLFVVARSALADPLAAAVVDRLRPAATPRRGFRGSGGLLLVLPTGERSRRRRTRCT